MKVSLRMKILVAVSMLVTLIVVGALGVVSFFVYEEILAKVARELTDTEEVLANYREVKHKLLFAKMESMVIELDLPTLMANPAQHREMFEQLTTDLQAVLATDFIALVDTQGQLVSINRMSDSDVQLITGGIIGEAIRQGQAATMLMQLHGEIQEIIAFPLQLDQQIVGAVLTGDAFNAQLAQNIYDVTQSKIAFVAKDRIVASAFAEPKLNSALNERLPTFQSGARGEWITSPQVVQLGDQRFLARAIPLDESVNIVTIVFRPLEEELSFYHHMQVMLFGIGGVALLISVLMSVVIARLVSRPVQEMMQTARHVTAGDLSARSRVQTRDELGVLARALNEMIERIETSQQTIEGHREELKRKVEERTRELQQSLAKLKATQDELIQSAKVAALGELVAGVAHEVNNPLQGISGTVELLLESDVDDAVKKDLRDIAEQAERCHHIVQNLLTFARKHKVEKQTINVQEILEQTLALREHQLKVNNIHVVRNFAPETPLTFGDFYQLQQVFLNLINNAADAMIESHGKGTLTVTTGSHNGMVQVEVIDDGPGISQEMLHKVFDPFVTTKQEGKGTGLGLSVAQGIIAEHQGKISARNNQTSGATFTVLVPRGSAVLTEPAKGE